MSDWRKNGTSFTRSKVRARDNHTCQDCKKVWVSGRAFDVHHLNGACGKKSQRYDRISDMDGLITLCHKCHFNRPDHSTFHIRLGRRLEPSKIQKRIIAMRVKGYTLQRIGNRYGITRQRVHQIVLKFKA